MVPVTDFCGVKISRLVAGGNTVSGTSHVNSAMDAELLDYFSASNIKKMLFRCMEAGINTMQFRGDKHITRLIREFRLENGVMNWIAQSAPEMNSFDDHVRQMAACKPALMYHHGVVTDNLFKAGETGEIKRRLDLIRGTGIPAGLCTHMPEIMEYSEAHHWGADFYMCCVYNVSVPSRQEQAKREGGEEVLFVESDIPLMYEAIRSVNKPCLAFKILGATRRCKNQDTVKAAFNECYASIKPGDAAVVGMFPKYLDQVTINAGYAEEAIRRKF